MKSVQQGFVVVVSLMLLVALSVIAAATARIAASDAGRVTNAHQAMVVRDGARQGLERALSDRDFFGNDTTKSLSYRGLDVTVKAAECRDVQVMSGFSLKNKLSLEETYWEFEVNATDTKSDTAIDALQGVRIVLAAGGCT